MAFINHNRWCLSRFLPQTSGGSGGILRAFGPKRACRGRGYNSSFARFGGVGVGLLLEIERT